MRVMLRGAVVVVGLLAARAVTAAPPVVQQVTAADRLKGDWFGWSAAIEGDVAVVGAPGRTQGPYPLAGAAVALRRSDGAWAATQTLAEIGTASTSRQFGHRVALAGGLLAIGAPGYGAAGGVYLYHDEDGGWVLDGLIYDQVAIPGEKLGVAVAIAGTTALAGSTTDTLPTQPGDTAIGRVRVFEYAAGWMETVAIAPGDPTAGNRFGMAVAIDGDTAVVGAPGKDTNRGVAYVFTRGGDGWTQVGKLAASDRQIGDLFGAGVAIAGDAVLVGAYGAAGGVGQAYVFERAGEAWSQTQVLTAPTPTAMEYYGLRVGLSGGYALVSGYGFESVPNMGSRGGGYLYGRLSGGYALLTELRAQDGVPGDLLGVGAGLSGGVALLGAPFDDAVTQPAYDPSSGFGSAYVFRLNQAAGEGCVADADCGAGVCCAEVCAAACEAPTTGEEASSGDVEATSSGSGEASSGGPPTPELEPLSEGCGCRGGGGGPLVWVLVGPLLLLRRRWRAG